eukprot:scaffold14136_cov49-Phaeocystis_antarctica.AAC.1
MSSLFALDREVAYCRVARRAYDAVGGVARESGRRSRCKQRAGEGSAADWGRGTEGGAHVEYAVHVRDAGDVEAQRLVERRRGLPRLERRAYDAGRGCGPGGERQQAAAVRCKQRAGGAGCRLGAGYGEERTENMNSMLVTLEVSKLSGWLNAVADCRESKGGHAVRGE